MQLDSMVTRIKIHRSYLLIPDGCQNLPVGEMKEILLASAASYDYVDSIGYNHKHADLPYNLFH